MDYDTNVHGSAAFEVPLLEADVWRVNDCVDTIRMLQHDFVLRQQRGVARYEEPVSEEWWEDDEGPLTALSLSQAEEEEYHSADELQDDQVSFGAGSEGA